MTGWPALEGRSVGKYSGCTLVRLNGISYEHSKSFSNCEKHFAGSLVILFPHVIIDLLVSMVTNPNFEIF